MSVPLQVEATHGVLTLRLARPKANIIDGEMIAALRAALREHGRDPHLKALLLTSVPPHFSFGASVEEHRPESAPAMLAALHALFREIWDLEVPAVAAVRGQCLGGGLELALCASFIVASPDAKLGQPEIKLAAIAPLGSALLPLRVGQSCAERMLLTGATVDAAAAAAMRLVDSVAEDPEAAAIRIIENEILPHSASSLRLAARAARAAMRPTWEKALAEAEKLYVEKLCKTNDAREGVEAFLGKRAPHWIDA